METCCGCFSHRIKLLHMEINLNRRGLSFPFDLNFIRNLISIVSSTALAASISQLRQLLLLDLAALHNADGLIIRTIANVQVLKPVVLLTSVFHLDICHHRVFASAIAARENTRCCHGQSHHTSALQKITTSHISHFLTPHKLFCFFLFSFARLRKRRLVCRD